MQTHGDRAICGAGPARMIARYCGITTQLRRLSISVMKIDQRENLIRRYLLGELTEADQAALEQELLIDRGKFDRVWAVENELIDSYVRGEMSRAYRERFEGHYLVSPLHRERAAIAESFLADIDQAVGETVEPRRWLGGGTAHFIRVDEEYKDGENEDISEELSPE